MDLIDRQAAIDALDAYIKVNRAPMHYENQFWVEGMEDAERIIMELPFAQPDIVQCKDCRHHDAEEPGMVYCPKIIGGWVKNDWFCADGERRADDEN